MARSRARMMLLDRIRSRAGLAAGTDVAGTIERVASGASLTAENLWLLGCSAILASIGLDVGSAAVIIGAMLISPLMGPILGVGLGLGVTDRALLQRSLRELAFATGATILTSATYFLVSPLAMPTAELIARTRPTLLDVGVAFFGGVAGIVAGSRKNPSLALPGVAIATALMPPLCTAGFGLATRNWAFLLGAFYLYSLNAIFIALATFLVVRFLRFPHHEALTVEMRRREHRLVTAVAIVATLPSMYFLYDAVHRVRDAKRIADFVHREVEAPGRIAPQWDLRHEKDSNVLSVIVAGRPVDSVRADSLRRLMPQVGLGTVRLELVQSGISAEDFQRFQGTMRRDLVSAAAAAAAEDSAQRHTQIDSLRLASAARELASVFPEIDGVTYSPRLNLLTTDSNGAPPVAFIGFVRGTRTSARHEIVARSQALLRARLGLSALIVQER